MEFRAIPSSPGGGLSKYPFATRSPEGFFLGGRVLVGGGDAGVFVTALTPSMEKNTMMSPPANAVAMEKRATMLEASGWRMWENVMVFACEMDQMKNWQVGYDFFDEVLFYSGMFLLLQRIWSFGLLGQFGGFGAFVLSKKLFPQSFSARLLFRGIRHQRSFRKLISGLGLVDIFPVGL